MTTDRFWTPLIILLVVIIAVGGIFAWSQYQDSQAAEISLTSNLTEERLPNEIYIGGAVTNPGFYPLRGDNRIEALVQAAGGTGISAEFKTFKLHIDEVGEESSPQKINLNRAEIWLLEALPGIGEERAKAIITYRREQGPFHTAKELLKVPGIGIGTFEGIKYLVTVAD